VKTENRASDIYNLKTPDNHASRFFNFKIFDFPMIDFTISNLVLHA